MTADRHSRQTLAELMVQSSLDGLLALDREYRYTLWNRAMEEFAGKRADEVLGRRVLDVFPFLRDLGLDLALERALAGETVTAEAVPHELPDGSRRYYDRRYMPLRDDGGAIIGVLGVVHDATVRRQAEDALRQAQKLEAVGQLTAGIAHNFNNMLMGILPYLEVAVRTAPPDVAALAQNAQHSAQRAANLVRQLLTYAGRNRAATRSVEVMGLLVERVVALCRTTFDPRIAFETRYQAGAHARVDAAQIEQAVLNILINARDALEGAPVDAPCVRVAVDVVAAGDAELQGRAGDHARIRIDDNGAGMESATLARIYEPFFTTKEVGRGTGLGLATTYAIVREHGGWMACESARGRGTTLSLYLPIDAGASDEEQAPPRRTPGRGTETVLVVDDEPAIRHVVPLMLRGAGYDARVAASGEQAIELLSDPAFAAKVALVLLDVSMPGMPGGELRRRLGELVPRARVLYFTGYPFEATRADDAVLEKPATEEQLLRAIRDALDRPARTTP